MKFKVIGVLFLITCLATLSVAIDPVCSNCDNPQDLNGDGLYEDVNGDNVIDESDLDVFFDNKNSLSTEYFDFNDNGEIDYKDFEYLQNAVENYDSEESDSGSNNGAESDKSNVNYDIDGEPTGEKTVVLDPGWNMISVSGQGKASFKGIKNTCSVGSLYAYNKEAGEFVKATEIDSERGYWVEAEKKCTAGASFYSDKGASRMNIVQGKSIMSVPSQGVKFSDISQNCKIDKLLEYNPDSEDEPWKVINKGDTSLDPTQGYLVKNKGDLCNLQIESSSGDEEDSDGSESDKDVAKISEDGKVQTISYDFGTYNSISPVDSFWTDEHGGNNEEGVTRLKITPSSRSIPVFYIEFVGQETSFDKPSIWIHEDPNTVNAGTDESRIMEGESEDRFNDQYRIRFCNFVHGENINLAVGHANRDYSCDPSNY